MVKGSYLSYAERNIVKHIIYPSFIPGKILERADSFPDLNGKVKFGPSIEIALNKNDFSIDNNLIDRFYMKIKQYLPKLHKDKLSIDYAGIRPKIKYKGKDQDDFVFDFCNDMRWLDLWGIDSPGLTCCLSIAEYVSDLIEERKKVCDNL